MRLRAVSLHELVKMSALLPNWSSKGRLFKNSLTVSKIAFVFSRPEDDVVKKFNTTQTHTHKNSTQTQTYANAENGKPITRVVCISVGISIDKPFTYHANLFQIFQIILSKEALQQN